MVVGSAGTVSKGVQAALLAGSKHKDFMLASNIGEYSDKHAAKPLVEEDL